MPSTRRSVLLGAAGTIAALAGCNESTSDGPRSTVTPVDVPKTRGEALEEAARLDKPEITPGVRVTEDHLAAAIADAESLVSDLRSAIDRAGDDIDLRDLQRRGADEPDDVVRRAESRLESVREMDPSQDALSMVNGAVREVALPLGYIEAELGDLDRETLETAIDDEVAATEALADRFSYRVAAPISAYLPTLRVAETTRPDPGDIENAREPLADAESGRIDEANAIALARRQLEVNRRSRTDAARFLTTATDSDRPSVRAAIEDGLSAVHSEVEAIAETYADRDPPDNISVEGEIRNIRIHVGRRSRRWLSELEDDDGSSSLRLLLDVSRWLVEFASLDAAVARTIDAMDDEEIPSDAILAAKRDAVDAIGSASEGTALQRELASRSASLVRTADRNATTSDDARTVARTHLLYAAAAEWAVRALERGDWVASTLQAQQS